MKWIRRSTGWEKYAGDEFGVPEYIGREFYFADPKGVIIAEGWVIDTFHNLGVKLKGGDARSVAAGRKVLKELIESVTI